MSSTAPRDQFKAVCELLDSALRLYFEGEADFAALHLSGAAEELLGNLLRARDCTPVLDNLQDVMMKAWTLLSTDDLLLMDGATMSPKAIAEVMNRARNHVKHSTQAATYDARSEARDMLERALLNYRHLLNEGAPLPAPSELMQRFDHEFFERITNAE